MNKASYPDVEFLVDLALDAGEIILRDFRLGMKKAHKRDGTPVTKTDEAINELVIRAFRKNYRHISVAAEEGSRIVPNSEYIVYCDPLDGTGPFTKGIPIMSFVISLNRGNIPLAAVIFDPFLGRMWIASKGRGTFLNGVRTRVSNHQVLQGSHMYLICWEGVKKFRMDGIAEKLRRSGVNWVNIFSSGYFGGLISSGQFEASIFPPGPLGWETPAIQLIVEEAGGVATDIDGYPLTYGPKAEINGHLISNGHLHDTLLGIIASYRNRSFE